MSTDELLAAGSAHEVPLTAGAIVPTFADNALPGTLFYTLKGRLLFSHTLTVAGSKRDVRVASNDTIGDLKEIICGLCGVPPSRQKILGLVKGKLPHDNELLDQLGLFDGKPFSVLGTKVGEELQRGDADLVLDDLDVDYGTALLRNPQLDERNKRHVQQACAKLDIAVMNEPRPGKRLLCLDIDYTILDCSLYSDKTVHAIDMARPGLDGFLTFAYEHYDIVIWSQTSWMWVESKLVELGMIGHEHERYRISFVLDKRPMITVQSLRDGKPHSHQVKALSIIWAKFPQFYSQKNTLHIDDLGRNFVLNPSNGIKCRPFKDARKHRDDKELFYLTNYLRQMLDEPDLSKVDHSGWRKRPGVKDGPVTLPPG